MNPDQVATAKEQAAIAAVVAHADLLGQGGWPTHDTEAHQCLHGTDIGTMALLAGVLVCELGEPAREVLRRLAIGTAEERMQ